MVTSSLSPIRNWGFAAFVAFWPAAAFAGGGFDFSDLEFQAGGIGVITPKYEGSKSYEEIGLPFIFPGGKDGDDDLSFVDIDSVQYRLVKSGPVEAGPLAGVWLGRSDSDGAKLAGLGDIDAGLVVGTITIAAPKPDARERTGFERAGLHQAVLHAVDVDEGQIVVAVLAARKYEWEPDRFIRLGAFIFRRDHANAASLEFKIGKVKAAAGKGRRWPKGYEGCKAPIADRRKR